MVALQVCHVGVLSDQVNTPYADGRCAVGQLKFTGLPVPRSTLKVIIHVQKDLREQLVTQALSQTLLDLM